MEQRIERCRRTLTCILTEEEKRQYADDLARITEEKSALQDRKKEINSEFKSKIDKADADQKLFANRISTGREMREVECVWQFNYSEGIKHLIRTDTGEMIENKVLSLEERQMNLELEERQKEQGGYDGCIYEDDAEQETEIPPEEPPAFECQDCKAKKKKRVCGAENCTK